MPWHDTLTRILTSTRLLGGNDSAPLNVPIKQIEDNLATLRDRIAFRSLGVQLTTGELEAYPETTVGEWAAFTDSGVRQPIPAGSVVLVNARPLSRTSLGTNDPQAGAVRVGDSDASGNYQDFNGLRASNNTSHIFRCQGSALLFYPTAGSLWVRLPPAPDPGGSLQSGGIDLVRFTLVGL